MKQQLDILKEGLHDKNAPFGVDLLLPKVGKGARKTNYDYTKGQLPELIDIIIESGASLFVSAVGVPPKWAVDKLHAANIPCMNMIGHPKHVKYCLAAGVDIICAQGGQGGGHTGNVATNILIPSVVDACKGAISPFTGEPVCVVAAGGIYDGRGLAAALSMGADAVWVGTRFVCAKEAGAPKRHQLGVVNAGFDDTIRTIIYTGRPMRVLKTGYIMDWEENRQADIKRLTGNGILPVQQDIKERTERNEEISMEEMMEARPLLMGSVAGAINDIQPAEQIINEMVDGAVAHLRKSAGRIARL